MWNPKKMRNHEYGDENKVKEMWNNHSKCEIILYNNVLRHSVYWRRTQKKTKQIKIKKKYEK